MNWDTTRVGGVYGTATAASPSPSALFGVIVPGHPVLTHVTAVDATRWTVSLGSGSGAAASFVVFLTQAQPLPTGYAVGVYVARDVDMLFHYLGYLTDDKPSALFRVPVLLLPSGADAGDESNAAAAAATTSLVVGLSLERLDDVANLHETRQQPLQHAEAATRTAIAESLLKDLYNFVISYARCVGPQQLIAPPSDTEEYVVMPASFVDRWRERALRRIRKDANFLSGN